MTNGPVADTVAKPASRRAEIAARGCPTWPLGCEYEPRRQRYTKQRRGGGTPPRRCVAAGTPTRLRGRAARMSPEPGNRAKSRPALSPSRAADFKKCPLLYRFRAIDRLPEPPSTAQLRGSVVHAALEQLYSMPAAERGPQNAGALVGPAWEQVIAAEPDVVAALDTDQQTQLLDE